MPGMHHGNMGRRASATMQSSHQHNPMGMPMPGPQHDMMRGPSGGHHQNFPPQGVNPRGNSMNQSNNMGNSNASTSGSMNSNSGWQSDKDTPHRREMIQHM